MGALNGSGVGYLEDKRPYDYVSLSYLHERPLATHISLVVEPFLNIVNRPADGVDVGLNIALKKRLLHGFTPRGRPYFIMGTGAAYTCIGFQEQDTSGLQQICSTIIGATHRGFHWKGLQRRH